MDINLFPWHHYHLITEGENSVSLTAYSQACTNTKRSFSFGCFAESWIEKRRMVVFWPQATLWRLFVLQRQKKQLSFLSFLPPTTMLRECLSQHTKSQYKLSAMSFMQCNKIEDLLGFIFKMFETALMEYQSSWFSKLSLHLLKVTFTFITCNFLERYFSAAGTQHAFDCNGRN